MHGIATETVLYAIILVLALILLTILFTKLIPSFGEFVNSAMSGVKSYVCELVPWVVRWLC